jgi:anaerobic C4-dicarboxylate transporter
LSWLKILEVTTNSTFAAALLAAVFTTQMYKLLIDRQKFFLKTSPPQIKACDSGKSSAA